MSPNRCFQIRSCVFRNLWAPPSSSCSVARRENMHKTCTIRHKMPHSVYVVSLFDRVAFGRAAVRASRVKSSLVFIRRTRDLTPTLRRRRRLRLLQLLPLAGKYLLGWLIREDTRTAASQTVWRGRSTPPNWALRPERLTHIALEFRE